jgi:hypothetical protein
LEGGIVSNPVVLTQSNRIADGHGEVVAPGYGKHRYTLTAIDTTDFPAGGILEVEVTVGPGESDASFDLFPSGVPLPTEGYPHGSVAHQYDVPKEGTATLSYRFSQGQVFHLGAEGNWFSREGAVNTFRFRAQGSLPGVGTGLHPAEQEGIVRSLPSRIVTAIDFVNATAHVRRVYWLDFEGRRKLYGELRPGETLAIQTFLTHPWLTTDAHDRPIALYFPDAQKRDIMLE